MTQAAVRVIYLFIVREDCLACRGTERQLQVDSGVTRYVPHPCFHLFLHTLKTIPGPSCLAPRRLGAELSWGRVFGGRADLGPRCLGAELVWCRVDCHPI